MTHQPYSPTIANSLLPLLRPIVRDLHDAYLEFRAAVAGNRTAIERAAAVDPAFPDLPEEVLARTARLRELTAELQELGVTVHDPVLGLVSLPGLVDGRTVRLCWKLGEPEVRYWFEPERGYRDRRPLPLVTA